MATATAGPPAGSPAPIHPPTPMRRRLAAVGLACVAAYAAVLVALWLATMAAPVDWTLFNLFLYAPRWIALIPLAPLAVVALMSGRLAVAAWLIAAVVAAVPIQGVCIPWRTWTAGEASGDDLRVRVVTCNAEGKSIDDGKLGDFLDETKPDLVILQEFAEGTSASFLRQPGWQVRHANGVMIASRFPIVATRPLDVQQMAARGAGLHCDVEIAHRQVAVYSLHLPTPRDGVSAALRYRWWTGLPALREVSATQWHGSEVARRWVDEGSGPAIIGGDFNLPVEHAAYRRSWGDLTNAFSASGFGTGGSKFTRWHSIRIDHILTSGPWTPVACRVGPDVGSDHRPVVAELAWSGPRS